MADIRQRKSKVDAACAELNSLQKQGEKIPDRLPITDPQSRINPNKEGGFAPNYTPTVTVDIDSGLIVGTDVHTSPVEEEFMMGRITQVVESFSMEAKPKELLADGLMCSGENLAACKDRKIDLYSPIKLSVDSSHPTDGLACNLKSTCINGSQSRRMINHEQHEKPRIEQAKKRATNESQVKYARRRHSVERTFAVI